MVLLVLIPACSAVGTDGDSNTESLERQPFPEDEGAGRWRLEVTAGKLVGLEGKLSELPSGRQIFNVVNKVEGARVDVDGMDLAEQAIAVWLRGTGSSRHFLPEYSIGPVNSGVQEDWEVELLPGEYTLSVTMGGASEAYLSVR